MAAADGTAPTSRWWVEVAVVVWLCWIYDAVANLAPLRQVSAVAHAASILRLEALLHLDPEPAMDRWLSGHEALGWVAATFYDNAHFVVSFGVLAWLWWRHRDVYGPMRTTLALVNVVALVVFWRYPVAPPRLLPGAGIADVVAETGAPGSWHSGSLAHHANELAAMPSLHVAWAVWSAWAAWRVLRGRRWASVVWAYPVTVGMTVLATGNHFVADVVLGALLTTATVPVADRLARLPRQVRARRSAARSHLALPSTEAGDRHLIEAA